MRSALGEGSTFSLRLPMMAPGFERGDVAPEAMPGRTRPVPLALIIDDEQAARYVLRKSLSAVGCSVIEAANGKSGLQSAIAESPDVIFLDLRMPDMMGTEVLARLKREPATMRIPVVIATSQLVPERERERLGALAVAVLGKARLGEADGADQIRQVLRAANIPV